MFVYNLLMDTECTNKPKIRKRKAAQNVSFCVKKERNTLYQKVSSILQKPALERSKDEIEFLNNSKDVVHQITQRKAQRQKVKDRAQEYEDPIEILTEKCKTLAEAVINSNHLVVYTGAGISTAACIPDYRGSNGIWTLLQQGKDIGLHDLSQAEPTLTHMALYCLYRSGILKHVVSQNCDGLHLRSGIPRTVLSEVHGNMYLEVCTSCKPCNTYLRLFDVTEYTARYSHETLRLCYKCGKPLRDTIVHFGERGKLDWPLNWKTACAQADKADVILCLGSSLKVLKKYSWLWSMDKPVKKRPKLYIVNLQWTPKDDHSTLKINGKCDTVIAQMMSHLGLTIPKYLRSMDPIFYHATILHETEVHTTSRKPIQRDLNVEEVGTNSDHLSRASNQTNGSDGDTAAVCSSTDAVMDVKPEVHSNDNNDLTKSDSIRIENSEIKETSMDANSDKENDIISLSEDIKNLKKCGKETDVEIKVEKVLSDGDVANELDPLIEDSMRIKQEVKSDCQPPEENGTDKDEKSKSCSNTCWAVQPFIETSLSVLYSRSLWSDLSLYDTSTHQPVLLGPSILGWSDMNSSLIPNKTNKETSSVNNASEDVKSNTKASCSFCHTYYSAQACLFYSSYSSNVPLDSNNACLCCDGEEDEDENAEQEEDEDKTPPKVPNVNPGWFGKGYRKKIKKRR